MKTITTFFLLACLFPSSAIAGDHDHHAGHGAPAARKADAPAQAKPAAQAKATEDAFARMDTNRDGFVSKAELPAGHGLRAHFGMVDKNRDGKLDRKEFAAGMAMLR